MILKELAIAINLLIIKIMKTSLLLIVLIVINTSALISQPINNLIQDISVWWFLGIELCLILGFYINKTIKDLKSHCELDCNNLKLYIIREPKKI